MSAAIRFSPALKEVRIHLCQKSAASKGVREFIEKNYVELKSNNPKFPILIRECSGVEPKLWARFGITIFGSTLARVTHVTRNLFIRLGPKFDPIFWKLLPLPIPNIKCMGIHFFAEIVREGNERFVERFSIRRGIV